MALLKAYLDTNILIEYCWIAFFSETQSRKSPVYNLVDKGAKGEYEIYISFYTLIELWQHFSDYYLWLKALRDGYSYREFPKVREEYVLTKDEIRSVSELIEKFRNNEYLNYVEPHAFKEMGDEYFKIIMGYVRGHMNFYDALHVRTAIDIECDYFVTKDGELRKRFQTLINNKIINEPLKIANVNGFLHVLKQKPHS